MGKMMTSLAVRDPRGFPPTYRDWGVLYVYGGESPYRVLHTIFAMAAHNSEPDLIFSPNEH